MTDKTFRVAILLAAATIVGQTLSGCANETLLTSRLDSNGLTIVTLDDPVVLALPVHQLAASARDYAYLGPVEVNRMGHRDYYLWVGLASTIDRKLVDVSPPGTQELTLLIDGSPVTLPLVDWVVDLDQSPYATSAPLYATYAAHASLDQIHKIANAESVEVHFVSASGANRRYQKWQGEWSSWSLLVAAK